MHNDRFSLVYLGHQQQ